MKIGSGFGRTRISLCLLVACIGPLARAASGTDPSVAPILIGNAPDYAAQAAEVTRSIQHDFSIPNGLFAQSRTKRSPEFIWGNGVMFSALVGAARHDPAQFRPAMSRFFTAMDRYWDSKAKIPGYEPAPTSGNGHDKYYDDNAWMVLCFSEAYQLTRDTSYLRRARQCLDFVLSGWDDQVGGGIWWHSEHKSHSKNTCVNAPAAVGCLRMSLYAPAQEATTDIATAARIVAWTNKTLQASDALYYDNINVDTLHVATVKLTYNTALMIRADLGLYRATGQPAYLDQAKRSALAADWFQKPDTHAYRDALRWSHLLVEADLEMYRATGDQHLLQRAKDNADYEYCALEIQAPPLIHIDMASIARTLWLMADMQSDDGLKFWATLEGKRSAESMKDE